MTIQVITARNPLDLTTAVTAAIAAHLYPQNGLFLNETDKGGQRLCQVVNSAATAVTAYTVVAAGNAADFATKLATEFTSGYALQGVTVNNLEDRVGLVLCQAMTHA